MVGPGGAGQDGNHDPEKILGPRDDKPCSGSPGPGYPAEDDAETAGPKGPKATAGRLPGGVSNPTASTAIRVAGVKSERYRAPKRHDRARRVGSAKERNDQTPHRQATAGAEALGKKFEN